MKHSLRKRYMAYVAKFEQNVQELSSAQKKQESHPAFDKLSSSQFTFELQNYQSVTADRLVSHYHIQNGLPSALAATRLREDGPNIAIRHKERSRSVKVVESICTGFSPLLWVLAVLMCIFWKSMGADWSPYNGVVVALFLVGVVAINSLVPYLLELNESEILHQYDRVKSTTCIVVRDGRIQQLEAAELVIGDIVELQPGHLIPADLRLVQCDAMEVDASLLSGESQPRKVTSDPVPEHVSYLEANNTVFLGSIVSQGRGMGMVIATGGRTQLAKIAQDCGPTESNTALQTEMARLVWRVAAFAVMVAVFVVVYWAACQRSHGTSRIIEYLVTVMLAAVPVSLPHSISLGVSLVSRRLTRLNVLAKETGNMITLGAVTIALLDKTGILTQNLSDVCGIITALDVDYTQNETNTTITTTTENCAEESKSGDGRIHSQVSDDDDTRSGVLEASYKIAALCNEANLQRHEAPRHSANNESSLEAGAAVRYDAVGGKSVDRGLLLWAHQFIDVPNLVADSVVTTLIPFSTQTMLSVTAVSGRNKPDEVWVFVKGAPESVLPRCTSVMGSNGTKPMNEKFRIKLQELIDTQSAKGCRMTILAQVGPLSASEIPNVSNITPDFLGNLMFVSCVSFTDPPRKGAREMVQQLRGAGIMVVLLSGDSIPTTTEMACREGVIADCNAPIHSIETLNRRMLAAHTDVNTSIVVCGTEVEKMSQVKWDYVFQHTEMVFARTSPDQKLKVVRQCQARGHVVCVTGDGVNDSPAMTEAQVGIAINSGSDVIREVADVVLMADNVDAIPLSIKEGRVMFMNLQKTVDCALTGECWSVLLPVLLTYTLGLPNPVPIFHMIVVSCLTDIFSSVALMCEEPEGNIMTRPPKEFRHLKMLDMRTVGCSFVFGNLIAFGASFNYFLVMANYHYSFHDLMYSFWDWTKTPHIATQYQQVDAWKLAASVYFLTVVVGQMFALLSVRRRASSYFYCPSGVRNSLREWKVQWPIVLAWVCTLTVTLIFLYVPVFNEYCRTARVPVCYWGLAIGWGALWFVLAEACKLIFM